MAKTFSVEIVSPQRMVFQGEAESVTLPGVVAPFQVLYNHAPILTELEVGDIKIVDAQGRETHIATSGGFAEVKENKMTVIAEAAEAASEIDVKRAQSARERAAERVRDARQHTGDIDQLRAEAALARAMNRLKVADRM
ncbi:MAG TPA: F0F1 ATP synthase subunit epsilon [Candidatus Kapabacteria bacterium]|jgi:F-type H+-transporting ATPase subunit epsilon|nr:F0F1 ATP synthase subunit epsilon [Candidatus Kapabacteria bacterium]